MEFQAAVLHEVGQPLVIERITLGELQPYDVLVRVGASGLCHTDLEVIEGSLRYPLPIVLGHEGAGIVERVGSAVTRVKVGDKVICSWNPHCGHCFYCERNQPILCEPFTRHQPAGHQLDGTSRYSLGGRKLHHFSVMSSHAEYCVVPESGAIAVPPEIPFDVACLIGCGVMTGVGAVSRLARVEAGSHVAVIGCGAVGLNAVQAAAFEQAASVIAIDRAPAKLEQARRFGATHTIGPDCPDVPAAVRDLTAGRGVDYVFECAGGEAALQLMYDVVRPGGDAVILGKVDVNQKVSLRFGSMMGEKRVTRSSYGGARPRRDFPWLAQRYLDGKLMLEELISIRLPLARINDGFDAMRRNEIVRAVVTF
jgi:S-(hydroxymethyl)glutathione dehydrogenase/alcohol dehydrogenase